MVPLEDARACAKWAGKRLPHEWEWRYGAQGPYLSGAYPWGDSWREECAPRHDYGRVGVPRPGPVDAHPKGASTFGVMDLTGNVWQSTDEFEDVHTRAAILRGGGYYRPDASRWYFPSAYQLSEHGKTPADRPIEGPLQHRRLPLRPRRKLSRVPNCETHVEQAFSLPCHLSSRHALGASPCRFAI
jgi:hypothetical protein